jgi:ABC-2 type transport system permease protein
MTKTWLIIKREYLSRVRKRSFIIMSLLGPIIMAGVGISAIYLGLEEPEDQKILVIDENYPLFKDIQDTKLIDFDVIPLTLEDGMNLLNTDEYTALLQIDDQFYKHKSGALYFKKQPSFRVQQSIEEIIQQHAEIQKLEEFNISETDYRRLKAPFHMSTFQYDKDASTPQETDSLPAIIGLVFSVLIYLFIFMYSVQVMRGVIEEKTNRIIEVMISSVKPFQLMLGKILGVAAVGLTQFVIWISLTLSILAVGQSIIIGTTYDASKLSETTVMTDNVRNSMLANEDAINLTKFSKEDNFFNRLNRVNFPLMLGMFLFYFLGGYLLYSAMMAAVGSAVDNDTDTQQFILPITFPLLLAYISSFSVFSNPSSPIAVWMSIIPFTSPVIMLIRISFGIEAADLWQVWLSMFLLVATFILMVWISAKVYRTGILMYGKKPSFREMFKWIRYP